MAHTLREKSKLLARVRRIRGQVEAIERALEKDAGCTEVMQLAAAVRGAVAGLSSELVEHHIADHIVEVDDATGRRRGAQELIGVVRTYLK